MRIFIVLFLLSMSLQSQEAEVLYLGDSLSSNDDFGRRIYTHLKGKYSLHFESLCGSSPHWWVKGSVSTSCGHNVNMNWKKEGMSSSLKTLLDKLSPKYIVIQQGTNLLASSLSKAAISAQILSLLDMIPSDIRCIWIGPPDADDKKISDSLFTSFYSLLDNLLKDRCSLIDSWGKEKITHYPSGLGDGIHFFGKLQNIEEDKWFSHVKKQIEILL